MDIFLVGGAIRDQLLGLPIYDRDWVVTQTTPNELLALGYKPVGQDFPVFLHPSTGEEYALARTERKQGVGYKGFTFHYDPKVTLEEDLKRRDFTINAIAQNHSGQLIDPFNGQQDIQNKVIRHVSPAFSEDPLRVLRGARFAARFHQMGFSIHPDTLELMQHISQSGELEHLIAERVWLELTKVFQHASADIFFQVLDTCKALPRLFPELISPAQCLADCQPTAAVDPILLYSAALSLTLDDSAIQSLWKRLKAPNTIHETSLIVHHVFQWISSPLHSALDILHLLKSSDAFRKPERFQQAIQLLKHIPQATTPNRDAYCLLLDQSLQACLNLNIKKLPIEGQSGQAIGRLIETERLNRITAVLKQRPD